MKNQKNYLKNIKKQNIKKLYNLPSKVIFCKKCVVSNQRPRIVFDKNGVCNACNTQERNKNIDWSERKKKLDKMLSKYRRNTGEYDVVVPSSGGKDSAVVAHKLKYEWGMNPLTVTWSPNIYTKIGWENFQGLIKAGLPNILGSPDSLVNRRLMRDSLIEIGEPFQPFIYGLVNFPARVAIQHGINLVMDGENGEEQYGGSNETGEDTFDLKEQEKYWFSSFPVQKWLKKGYTKKDLHFYESLSPKEFIKYKVTRKFWSHYNFWDPQEHFYYASQNTGFKPNPDGRSESTYSKYASLDDRTDGFHYHFMYLKFGLGRCTSDAAHEIREGHLSRTEATRLVEKYDSEFPKLYYKEFLNYLGITEEEYKKISDSWTNRDLFYKNNKGDWVLKQSVGKENK